MASNIIVDAFKAETWRELPVYKQANWTEAHIGTVPYLQLTLAFTIVVFGFELYLDWRQLVSYKKTKTVPKEIASCIKEDTLLKAVSYGKEKLSFGIFRSTFGLFESIILTLLGFQPYVWDISATFVNQHVLGANSSAIFREMVISAVFFSILILQQIIITIPFSLYSSFVVEAKHGFNKMTLATFIQDQFLTLGLTIGIGGPLLAMVVWVIRMGGPHFYFYVWAFLFVVSLLFTSLFPVYIAPLFNKYTKLEKSPLYDAIQDLAVQVEFPLTQIFTVDGSKRSAHSNAYFYGFFKNKRIVLFDTLIKQVTQSELLAILGHEIGHWRLWHTLQNFVITQVLVFTIFILFAYVQTTKGMFEGFGFHYPTAEELPAVLAGLPAGAGPMPVLVGLMIFTQTLWAPIDKILTFVLNVNSRTNEFAADAYANSLGMAEDLKGGLIKIHAENLGNLVPDPWYSTYHFSHPSLVERLRALNEAIVSPFKKATIATAGAGVSGSKGTATTGKAGKKAQ